MATRRVVNQPWNNRNMPDMQKTVNKVSSLDRKKRAAMAYLSALGYGGANFDEAAQKWIAGSPAEMISYHKPIRSDGSLNHRKAVDAIFEEIDNVDTDSNPKIAKAVQNAYRIYRGKTSQIGDESGMYEPVSEKDK